MSFIPCRNSRLPCRNSRLFDDVSQNLDFFSTYDNLVYVADLRLDVLTSEKKETEVKIECLRVEKRNSAILSAVFVLAAVIMAVVSGWFALMPAVLCIACVCVAYKKYGKISALTAKLNNICDESEKIKDRRISNLHIRDSFLRQKNEAFKLSEKKCQQLAKEKARDKRLAEQISRRMEEIPNICERAATAQDFGICESKMMSQKKNLKIKTHFNKDPLCYHRGLPLKADFRE